MKTTYVVAGVIVVILALGFITASIYESDVQSSSTTSDTMPDTLSTSSETQTISSITSLSSIPRSSPTSGEFAMMWTDPPIVASGISSVIVGYDNLTVHNNGNVSVSGWRLN